MTLPPPRSTLFPYTTLFRSHHPQHASTGHVQVHLVAAVQTDRHGNQAQCVCGLKLRIEQQAGEQEQRSEEHTSELQSRENLVCRLLLEKKKNILRPSNCTNK